MEESSTALLRGAENSAQAQPGEGAEGDYSVVAPESHLDQCIQQFIGASGIDLVQAATTVNVNANILHAGQDSCLGWSRRVRGIQMGWGSIWSSRRSKGHV